MNPICLSIKQEETGKRIKQLLQDHGYKVKDIQGRWDLKRRRWYTNGCQASRFQAWTTS